MKRWKQLLIAHADRQYRPAADTKSVADSGPEPCALYYERRRVMNS